MNIKQIYCSLIKTINTSTIHKNLSKMSEYETPYFEDGN